MTLKTEVVLVPVNFEHIPHNVLEILLLTFKKWRLGQFLTNTSSKSTKETQEKNVRRVQIYN